MKLRPHSASSANNGANAAPVARVVRLYLRPGQSRLAPSPQLAALMMRIEIALKTFEYVIDADKAGRLQGKPGIDGPVAAPADEDHRSMRCVADCFFHMPDKMRIDFPVRAVVPRDHDRAHRMADKQKLHFAATIDEYRRRLSFQEFTGLLGRKMIHDVSFRGIIASGDRPRSAG